MFKPIKVREQSAGTRVIDGRRYAAVDGVERTQTQDFQPCWRVYRGRIVEHPEWPGDMPCTYYASEREALAELPDPQ